MPYQRFLTAAMLTLGALSLCAGAGMAQTSASAPTASALSLSLSRALQLALSQSPEIRPAREAERAYRQAATAADAPLLTNPQIELLGGVRRTADQTRPEWGAAISQSMSVRSVVQPRKRAAQAAVGLAQAQLDEQRLALAREVAQAWIELRTAEQRDALQRSRVERSRLLAQTAAGRAAAGAGSGADVALAAAAYARQESRLRTVAVERARAAQRLSLLLDLESTPDLSTVGALPSARPNPSRDTLLTHPASRVPASNAALLEAQANSLLAEGGPRVEVGASVVREGTGDWVVLGRVGLPIPWVNGQSYAAAEHRAPATAYQVEARHWIERLGKQRTYLQRRQSDQEALVTHIRTGELQAVKQALAVVQAQFDAGKVALPLLLATQEEEADVQESLVESEAKLFETRVETAWTDGTLVRWSKE